MCGAGALARQGSQLRITPAPVLVCDGRTLLQFSPTSHLWGGLKSKARLFAGEGARATLVLGKLSL